MRLSSSSLAALALAILLSLPLSAQSNLSFKKGYHGTVELGMSAMNGKMQQGFIKCNSEVCAEAQMQPGEMIRISTVHGYAWGNGVFLGAGLGWDFELIDGAQYASFFADVKYNLKDASASPFIEGRTGYHFCTNMPRYETGAVFVSAAGGVDFGHISARLGYEYCPIKQNYRSNAGQLYRSYYSMNQFFFSLAFNF